MNTFQLWEGLSAESLGKLAQLQWNMYHLKLELITTPHSLPSPFTEVEDAQEIDKIMRKPTTMKRWPK